MRNIFLSTCTLAAIIAPAFASQGWTSDLAAALEQAAKENKAVMVDFNGSDWCGPCIALKSKVLDTAAFASYAKDKFLLVDIDLPRGDIITPEQKAKNEQWANQYAIRNYPTILVLNKDGLVMGGFKGSKTNIADVQAELDAALLHRPHVDEAWAKAASLTGPDKAQALMTIYELVPESIRANNATLRAQIIAADPKDACGLLAAEEASIEKKRIQHQIMGKTYSLPAAERIVYLNTELARPDLSDTQRLALQAMRLQLDLAACETAEDLKVLRQALEAFAQTAPSEKEAVKNLLTSFLAKDDAEILKHLESIRKLEKTQKARVLMWLL